MTGQTKPDPLNGCTECGWKCSTWEYHPLVACAIVKEVRRMTGLTVDPMPYLRMVADDMTSVGPDREFRPKEAEVPR